MQGQRGKWTLLWVFVLTCETASAAGIRLEFTGLASPHRHEIETYLRQSRCLNEIVGRLTRRFRFPADVILQVGTHDGPLYDVSSRTIHLPFDLGLLPSPLDERLDMVERRLLYPGAVTFAVSHEMGHAFIHLYRWPVHAAAEEEEAADAIAVYLVLNVFDSRDTVLEALADIVLLGSSPPMEKGPNLRLQPARANRLLCWLAGSDPEGFGWLWKTALISDRTPQDCRSAYGRIEARFEDLLRPAERSTSDDPR